MDSTTLNISLPESLKAYVEAQVEVQAYSSASEYIRELIRADQKHKAEEKLVGFLLEGLNSLERGEKIELTPHFWEDLRKDLRERFAKKTTA